MENKTQTTIRLKKDIYKRVVEEANKMGISINAYITMILSKELCQEN